MATEIVHWCDVHLTRDERVPVVAVHRVTLDGAPLVLELCETCEVEVFKPLAGFLGEHGVPERVAGKPVKASKPAATTAVRVSASANGRTLVEMPSGHAGRPNIDHDLYPCMACDGVVEGRHPFARHLRQQHNTTSTGLYGTVCPLCAHPVLNVVGLAAHGRATHDTGGLFSLFEAAREQGDPHGIVAARLSAVAGA